MKKLFTLFAAMFAMASLNAQNCDFTFSVNPSGSYTFTAPAGLANSGYAFQWSLNNGSTYQSGYTFDYTYTSNMIDVVSMYVFGGGPDTSIICSSTQTIIVTGDSTNVTPSCNADFYASTSALVGYYIPTGNYYSNSSTYLWSFGDGSSSTSMYPYHEYTNSGSYNVCLIVNDGECGDTTCQYVYIPANNTVPSDSLCNASFVISQSNPFEISVVNTSSDLNSVYTWTLSSGLLTVTATGSFPTILVENTGSFLLCITSTNASGCTSTFCDSIVVDANGMIGGRLSSAGFTINVVSPQTITGYDITGVENVENATISVYPNPFNDVLSLSGVASNSTIQIFSFDGKNVYQGNATSSTLNTSNLSAGVYMLSITDVQGNRQVQKIVKK